MSDLEAIGDAATGGIIARAVEPNAGEGAGHTHERNCLNCGCALTGDYCHCCGQKAHVHRTLGAFWHDLLHGVLHFEGKIWRTLPLLAAKPGALTRRYIDGQRASLVSPIALFLFSVFLMFAVVSIAIPLGGDLGVSNSLAEAVAEERSDLVRLEGKRKAATGAQAAKLDAKIKEKRSDIAELEELRAKGVTTATFDDAEMTEGDAWFQEAYKKAKANPELLIYKLKTNAYKFSWALIPISVPFVWLLFPFNRRFTLYDHVVFVTYSLSFMTLLVVVIVLLSVAGLSAVAGFASFIPPIHMYLQLKGAYGLSRWSAAWRTMLLVTFAFMVVSLFSGLLLMMGVFD
jgi:hypothetical protein